MARVTESWSVGQLLTIRPENRVQIIARMPVQMRLSLANLAQHGLARDLAKVESYRALLGELTNPDTVAECSG